MKVNIMRKLIAFALVMIVAVACHKTSGAGDDSHPTDSNSDDSDTFDTDSGDTLDIIDSSTTDTVDSSATDTADSDTADSADSSTSDTVDSDIPDTSDSGTETESDTATDSDSQSGDDSAGDSATETDTQIDTETVDSAIDTGTDTTPLPDPVENEWVYIEGGSFEMGHDGDRDSTKPVHTVSVPTFEILKTEVTVHQYRQCVDAGVCTGPHQSGTICSRTYANNWLLPERLNYPVNCIDHIQATAYCQWLGARLPSESEWEYAARGGGQDILYPWGNDAPTCELVAATDDIDAAPPGPSCWSRGGLPVCSKPLGNSVHDLCDMSGNYAEWVADIVSAAWGYDGAPTDGSPRIETDYDDYAVFRGGNAFDGLLALHVYDRVSLPVDYNYTKELTIRCARNIE